jgi:hypothetical protein
MLLGYFAIRVTAISRDRTTYAVARGDLDETSDGSARDNSRGGDAGGYPRSYLNRWLSFYDSAQALGAAGSILASYAWQDPPMGAS